MTREEAKAELIALRDELQEGEDDDIIAALNHGIAAIILVINMRVIGP